jgi:hypothetical protein
MQLVSEPDQSIQNLVDFALRGRVSFEALSTHDAVARTREFPDPRAEDGGLVSPRVVTRVAGRRRGGGHAGRQIAPMAFNPFVDQSHVSLPMAAGSWMSMMSPQSQYAMA